MPAAAGKTIILKLDSAASPPRQTCLADSTLTCVLQLPAGRTFADAAMIHVEIHARPNSAEEAEFLALATAPGVDARETTAMFTAGQIAALLDDDAQACGLARTVYLCVRIVRTEDAEPDVFYLGALDVRPVPRPAGLPPSTPESPELPVTSGDLAPHVATINFLKRTGGEGMLTLVAPSGARKRIKPDDNTPAGRWATGLKDAIAAVQDGDAVNIEAGHCLIPPGECMKQWLASGNPRARVRCTSDLAAHVYASPGQAENDYELFEGPRNVRHFGALRSVDYVWATDETYDPERSASDAFEAAERSLNYAGEHFEELGRRNRMGSVVVPEGLYVMTRPHYTQSNQTWIATGEGRTILRWVAGCAPLSGGQIKWAWRVARNMVNGVPQANFSHDVRIKGFVLNCMPQGNELLAGMRFGGAQGSYLKRMTIGGFAGGVYVDAYTDQAVFENIEIGRVSTLAHEGFVMDRAFDCILNVVSVKNGNEDGEVLENDDIIMPSGTKDGGARAAFFFNGCQNVTARGLLAEDCARGVRSHANWNCDINITQTPKAGYTAGVPVTTNAGGGNRFAVSSVWNEVLIVDNGIVRKTGLAQNVWVHETYEQSATIRNLQCETLTMSGRIVLTTNRFIDFDRPGANRVIRIATGNADNNPDLNITIHARDGSITPIRALAIAANNGGASAGYLVTAHSLFVEGPSNLTGGIVVHAMAGNPTTDDVLPGRVRFIKNTITGEARWWFNDNGTLKSLTFS